MRAEPAKHRLVPGPGGGERFGAQHRSVEVHNCWGVQALMGVDAPDDLRKPMGVNVLVRSSFSNVIDRVTDAESRAKQAEQNASDAKNEASRLRENISLGGIITAIVLVVGITGFIATVYNSLAPRIDKMHARVSRIEHLSWDKDSRDVSATVEKLVREVGTLRSKI